MGGRPSEAVYLGRKGHGMVWRENIDSGYPNFQLDTRSSGSRRNLGYILIRRTLTPLTYSKGAGRQGVVTTSHRLTGFLFRAALA